jgi:hypothetical protein
VCVCVCVCVSARVCVGVGGGVGASWRATRDPGPRASLRASVSSFNGASGGIVIV